MYSPAAFHASRSVMPGSDEARKMTATSGRTCSAVLTKSSPITSLLRTLLESSRWSSKARFLRWQVQPTYSIRSTIFEDTDCARPLPCNASATTLKVTDIPSSRCLFRLVPLEPRTDATGSSSSDIEMLPTPVVVDNPHPNSKVNEQGRRYNNKQESSHSMGLADMAHHLLLPTPLVVEREHPERVEALKATGATRINIRANGEQRPNGLLDFMQFYDMLPTPQTQGLKVCDENGKTQFMDLDMLPTPTTDIHKNAGISEEAWEKRIEDKRQEDVVMAVYKMYKDADMLDAVKDGRAFRLSPLFTEEMMGFPLMWTTLPFLSANGAPKPSKPTATPSSRK